MAKKPSKKRPPAEDRGMRTQMANVKKKRAAAVKKVTKKYKKDQKKGKRKK